MSFSVIIPTLKRPDCIRRNLECLRAQEPQPDQVVVVDASPDDRTEAVVAAFPAVLYLRNPAGRGNTPSSRNLALLHCAGDIIGFLDDDAFVHPGWLAAMLATYADSSVAGVAGRALNGLPGEEKLGVNEIGRIKANGFITGNFAADPGRIVEVDHAIGCNMSIRREVLAHLGGFKDDYKAGPFGICEETEIFVRAKRLGYRFVFNPAACADHMGAPQPGGRRFSPQYSYYHSRNVMVMLVRNYGWTLISWRHLGASTWHTCKQFVRKMGGAVAHVVMGLAGVAVGAVAGTILMITRGRDPIRRTPVVQSAAASAPPATRAVRAAVGDL